MFCCVLPIVRVQYQTYKVDYQRGKVALMNVPYKILYIEDSKLNKALVRQLLSTAGYEVVDASDGLSGIETAKREYPDLILMDMNIPILDGYEATTRIKGTKELAKTPVVALTANDQKGDRERSLTAGCDGYIPKPIDVDNFVIQVESYLRGKQEGVESEEAAGYLKEYNQKLVTRLVEKVHELEQNNLLLEARVAEKMAELQTTQEQLLRAEKLESMGRLAAGIAHEINTPIQFVGDNTRFLKDSFVDLNRFSTKVGELIESAQKDQIPLALVKELKTAMQQADLEYLNEEIPHAIGQTLEGVERVAKIVRAMKEFSHPASENKAIDLNHAIESTITVARNEWKYVAHVVTDLDTQLPPVTCHPSEFNQVILNMIINAAHAVGEVVNDSGMEKGTITIATRCLGDWVEIRISDTGVGIPDDVKPKIFDHFFTTKEIGKGTGQGLSVAHAVIVNRHGGSISVDSKVGLGTSFLIRLPIKGSATSDEEVAA